jgi:GT2 family glycosyltransferase
LLSIGIATYNRPRSLVRCVRSLLAGSIPPAEVVVVDQSEGQETERALAELPEGAVRYVRHRPPSSSGARNRAVELAGGEFAALLDDDVEAPAHWMEDLQWELGRRAPVDALFGALRSDRPLAGEAIPASVFSPPTARAWTHRTFPDRLGFSAHLAVRRSSFQGVGGFDERLGPGTALFAAEDMDLNFRLLKAGCRVHSTPEVWVTHHQWRRPEELPELYYRYGVGMAAVCAKHLRSGDAFAAVMLARHLGADAKMAASAVRRRSRLRARIAAARWRGTALGLGAGWRTFASG